MHIEQRGTRYNSIFTRIDTPDEHFTAKIPTTLQNCKHDPGRIMSLPEQEIYSERRSKFFQEFTWPFGYYEPDEYLDYLEWDYLECVGLKALRVESVPTEMILSGKEGVKAMIRATWLRFTSRIPEALRQDFIDELANKYVEIHPTDSVGLVHFPLTRLEVDALKV